MNRICILFLALFGFTYTAKAQVDSSLFRRQPVDTTNKTMNMDAIYNRPFLNAGKLPVSLGGYMEVNWQHLTTDGISQGHQFQMRRMSLFIASTISQRIKFLSEIEFENNPDELAEGGKSEVDIEFAAIDIEFHPMLNLRGGIILNPIGAFNQNHDGPKWEFTDRPIAMTKMLPATWSNAGMGLYGKYYNRKWMFGYECYLSGGFDGSIINNDKGRTYLPESRENASRLAGSASGEPLFTGKLALRRNQIGEIGLSYMGGAYNAWMQDGLIIDTKRRLDVIAVDINTTIPKTNTNIIGEWAWIMVQVPTSYSQQYGTRQHGGFIDFVQPIIKRPLFGWKNSVVNVACRFEYMDFNVGTFQGTDISIGDQVWSIMPALSFRPNKQTVLRLNYRYLQQTDLFNNPPSLTGGFIFGVSSYF